MKLLCAILGVAGLAAALPGHPHGEVLVKRSFSSSSFALSTSSSSSSSSVAAVTPSATPYCSSFSDPDHCNPGWCQCSNGGDYSFATGSVPCPYTTIPPASLSVTSTPTCSSTSSTTSTSAITIPTQCAQGVDTAGSGSCFTDLDLGDYVTTWWSENEAECTGGFPGFADCWYSKVANLGPSTCDEINADPACQEPGWADFPSSDTRDFWVTFSIWNTQALFDNIYTAIGDSATNTQGNIGTLTTQLDPPTPTNKDLSYVLDAMTFGLGLVSVDDPILTALVNLATQTVGLFAKLFPSGTINQQVDTWAEVQGQVDTFVQNWQTSVGEGLPLIQDNVTAFAQWGSTSGISANQPTLPQLTANITLAIGATAAAAMINDLGLAVSRAADTDVHALQTNGTKLQWDTGCEAGYDSNGVCNTFFWDGTDTYTIVNPTQQITNYTSQMATLIVGDTPITTGELLFTGGLQCAQSCGTNGGCPPTANGAQSPATFTCLSNLRICTWTYYTAGPYTDCDASVLPEFGPDADDDWEVPLAYLGGGILDPGPGFWAGNAIINDEDDGQ